jgi:hypothetical protein
MAYLFSLCAWIFGAFIDNSFAHNSLLNFKEFRQPAHNPAHSQRRPASVLRVYLEYAKGAIYKLIWPPFRTLNFAADEIAQSAPHIYLQCLLDLHIHIFHKCAPT